MHVLKSIVFLAVTLAGGTALSDARFSTDMSAPTGLNGLVYAQLQIDDLTVSDLRRLNFYADRASKTLQSLIEGADSRSIIEQDKVNLSFRASISRLADAGARSGLSMDQVADFFTQVVLEKFGQGFMQQVSALAGGLDFRTLFRNVSTVPDPRTTVADSGSEFLNALAEASRDLDLSTDSGTIAENPTVEPVAPIGPQALPNANAAERAVIERIRVIDGRWELTVRSGDSLSVIASALYGDALSYTVIYNANNRVISNPNVIDVGTVLVLPQR